ncbi:unnamed protein product [Meloidogyne enterolobii]|uniref:Uncharacterized protein n=1 Tax=Meloidogyne enterolobii TaxID=390850 RepID=A0ACB1AQR2_MELEN
MAEKQVQMEADEQKKIFNKLQNDLDDQFSTLTKEEKDKVINYLQAVKNSLTKQSPVAPVGDVEKLRSFRSLARRGTSRNFLFPFI